MSICPVNATLDEKLEAIRNRTPDQKMIRDGVPVSIGGRVFEVKPLVRKQNRQFRKKWADMVKGIIGLEDLKQPDSALNALTSMLDYLDSAEPLQLEAIALAIPELQGQGDWLDENATNEELSEVLLLALHINGLANPTQPPKRGA